MKGGSGEEELSWFHQKTKHRIMCLENRQQDHMEPYKL